MLAASKPFSGTAVVPIDGLLRTCNQTESRIATIPPRTRLFLPGIDRSETFRIRTGCIALFQLLPDGRRQIVDILGPDRLFGRGISDLHQCGAEALCETEVELVTAVRRSLDAEINQAVRLMLRRAQAHATLLGRKTAGERIASALIDLAGQFAGEASSRFQLHLTRTDLADWLGLTLETVSRYLNRFRREGLVSFEGPSHICLRDRAGLELIAGGRDLVDAQ
ncbi:helix-turn-helix domain-containing protein [Microvirga tunisiensis]|uniref:Helix-turn-helix domain-containing protein n=2 Tax=Pannonibacter tanglangensis TaxID=2750084 RepID=A0A7X5JAI8_9HYPH|nr:MULTISPECIES: helix-turn-helix domain-containing protein [unclassified Pannonibacter]NBN65706.1 helix-turn-helix domain-containing protein [Pannonibacter sp. XCT-34]NBN80067.1 helix-turn-helix domain-containing protein [Pannonibacter sp. XCT-53]